MVKFVLPQLALHIKKPNIDHNKKTKPSGLVFFVVFASLRRFALLSDFTCLIVVRYNFVSLRKFALINNRTHQ